MSKSFQATCSRILRLPQRIGMMGVLQSMPSLHHKLNYDRLELVRELGDSQQGLDGRWWHICWREGSCDGGAALPFPILDLCWKEAVAASQEPQIVSLSFLHVSTALSQTQDVWTHTKRRIGSSQTHTLSSFVLQKAFCEVLCSLLHLFLYLFPQRGVVSNLICLSETRKLFALWGTNHFSQLRGQKGAAGFTGLS